MSRRKYLIALSAAAIASLSVLRSASADEVADSVNPYQIAEFAPLDLTRHDYTADTVVPVSFQLLPVASTDAVWTGGGSNALWTNVLNWSTNVVPDDPASVARFTGLSGGQVANLGGASISISALTFSDPQYSGIVSGTISLGGALFANGANFDLPEKVFATFGIGGIRGGNNIGGAGSLAASFVGANGLTKSGDTHLQIDSAQFYTGTTSISGGKIITTVGDSAFGAGNDAIVLNNGSIQVATSDWVSTRNINVLDTSSIYWVGSGRSINYNGNILGNGTLILNGNFGTNVGNANIRSNNSLTGVLNVGGGTVTLSENGAFLGVQTILNSGTIELNNASSGSNVNRLSDTAVMNSRGAAITVRGGNAAYDETIGQTLLDGGTTMVTVDAGSGGAQLHLGSVTRNNSAGLFVQGQNLGNAPGANVSNVYITNGGSLLVKNLLPFAWVNPNYSATSTPETPDNVLATYGANGVMPVTTYQSDFVGSGTLTNVRISSTGTFTLNGNAQVNALVLAAPQGQVYPVPSFSSTGGMTLQGNGANFIQVDSGVVLSAYAGNSGNADTLNSVPGNVVNINLQFGTKQAVILTPSAITLSGVITGSGGLVKLGPRTAVFSGNNLYTGETMLTGFNRFVGNVRKSAFLPSPFGLSTTPIVLYGGNASPVNNGTLNGTGIGQLGCETLGGITTFDRDLLLRGDTVMLRNFGTGFLHWNGEINLADPKTLLIFLSAPATGHQVVNGSITGAGQVVIGSTDPGPSAVTYVDLMTAQTFNGGLSLSGGTIGLGNDRALGSHTELIEDIPTEVFNTVRVSGTSMISALGAARSIKNDFVVYANTFGVGGSNAVTITGAINGRGGDYIANIANTATTTFAGMLTGGGFVKVGNGTLVITGENNNFTGPVNIGSATTSGGMVIAKTNNALGSSAGSTSVFDGQNALAFDASAAGGALTFTGETLYLSGAGIGSLGAVRNLNGNNTWNGLIQPSAQYAGAGTATPTLVTQTATIGVDAGTLTVNSAILGDDPGVLNDVGTLQRFGTSIGARKVGAGTLVVGSALLSDTSNSSLYNASVLITGTLDIAQGVVRIKPHSGVTGVSGGRSVVDLGGLKFAGTPTVPVGQLDLNDTAMIIDYADVNSSPLPTVRSYIRAGYKSGSWNGTGIVSSIVAASLSGAGRLGLGYAEAQDLSFSSVFGDSFDQDSLIVRSTYLGDTNLDGKVDVVDLGQMALAWSGPGDWINGDFNYDGVVNVRDLYEMALNWQLGVASPGAAPSLDLLLSSFGLPPIAVPEPSTIGLMAAAALLGLRRRRQSPSSTAAANAASIVRN